MEKIVNICNIVGLGLDVKTVIGFMIVGVAVIVIGITINTKTKVNMD